MSNWERMYVPRNPVNGSFSKTPPHLRNNKTGHPNELMRNGFSITDYMGDLDKKPTFDRVEDFNGMIYIGDSIFPILYIYAMGDCKMPNPAYGKLANQDMLLAGLTKYLEESFEYKVFNESSNTKTDQASKEEFVKNTIETLDKNISELYLLMIGAVAKNKRFRDDFCAEAQKLKEKYIKDLPSTPFRYGPYYIENQSWNNRQKSGAMPFPTPNEHGGGFGQAVEMFRILYEQGLIEYNHKIAVRPIDINTGEFAKLDNTDEFGANLAKLLGLPTNGILTKNERRPRNLMFRTFNGTDMTCLGVIGDTISEIHGMTSLSWSIHREKRKIPTVGRTASKTRSKGARTIAGTFVFLFSDQHPLAEIFPSKIQKVNPKTNIDDEEWIPVIMTDDIPPFDLHILMTNEYGFGTFFTLYGVDITSEGTVITTDSPNTEIVMNYTAASIDPVVQVKPNENGVIDIQGLYESEYFDYWRRREKAAAGVLNTDLEVSWEQHQNESFGKYRSIRLEEKRAKFDEMRNNQQRDNQKSDSQSDDTKKGRTDTTRENTRSENKV